MTSSNYAVVTSSMTGHHWGPKQQRRGWLLSAVTKTNVTCCVAFSSSSVVLRAFSALFVYSKFRHHPHHLGYLCAKYRFFSGLHCWASPWRQLCRKSISNTHKVDVSEDGRSCLADWSVTIVCDKRVDSAEMRSVIPQEVLLPLLWPKNPEMLDIVVDSAQIGTKNAAAN